MPSCEDVAVSSAQKAGRGKIQALRRLSVSYLCFGGFHLEKFQDSTTGATGGATYKTAAKFDLRTVIEYWLGQAPGIRSSFTSSVWFPSIV